MPKRTPRTITVGTLVAVGGLATVHGYAQGKAAPGGELVQNGDFEAPPANADALPGWSLVREGDAQGRIARDDAAPPAPAGPHALRLTVTRRGTRCGAANSGPGGRNGQGGMNVRAGAWYDVAFFCRTENGRHTGLVFSLESRDGRKVCARVTLPEVGGDWQPYTLSLHAAPAETRARLVISPLDPGPVWLDGISVIPRAAR